MFKKGDIVVCTVGHFCYVTMGEEYEVSSATEFYIYVYAGVNIGVQCYSNQYFKLKEPMNTIKLELTMEEAGTVHDILECIGGNPFGSRRQYADSAVKKLKDLGNFTFNSSDMYEDNKSIYFKDFPITEPTIEINGKTYNAKDVEDRLASLKEIDNG